MDTFFPVQQDNRYGKRLPYTQQQEEAAMTLADPTLAETTSLVERADFYRLDANRKLNQKTKSAMGQFMTPAPVCRFMASLFQQPNKDIVRLLDAGQA